MSERSWYDDSSPSAQFRHKKKYSADLNSSSRSESDRSMQRGRKKIFQPGKFARNTSSAHYNQNQNASPTKRTIPTSTYYGKMLDAQEAGNRD